MKHTELVSVDGAVARIEGYCGSTFHSICEEAIEYADKLNQTVEFEFNGVLCSVTRDSDPDDIWQYVNQCWDQQRSTHEATPEYKEMQHRAELAAAKRKIRMQELVSTELDHIVAINVELDTMFWLKAFVEYADWGDAEYDKQVVANKLKLLGYANDDLIGCFPDDPSNTEVFRWIVGQAINMLELGSTPHPALIPQTERCISTAEYEIALLKKAMTASSV
jgi:hypothetical protein